MAVTIKEVPVGSASVFRQTINDNFEAVKTEVDQEVAGLKETVNTEIKQVYETMTQFELSSVQPIEQKQGDFWLKILPDE